MCFKRTYVIVSPCFVKKETMHVLWKKKLRLYSFWRIPIVCFNPIKSSKWVPYDHTSVSWYGSNMVTLHFSMKTRIQRRKIDSFLSIAVFDLLIRFDQIETCKTNPKSDTWTKISQAVARGNFQMVWKSQSYHL